MNATILLVLLTLKGDAPLGVNFVNFDNYPACQARAAMLEKVLTRGGIKVVENRCLASFQYFSKHRHRATKGDHGKKVAAPERHVFLVTLGRKRALVVPQPDMKTCEAQKARYARLDGGARGYCALSEQRLLCEGEVAAQKRAAQKM